MDLDKKVFGAKTVGDLLKEAYETRKKREEDIQSEIDRLSTMITSPGEAVALSPLIKPLFDANLKNDEVLIKILDLFRKSASDNSVQADSVLSAKDLEQLMLNIPEVNKKSDQKLLDQ